MITLEINDDYNTTEDAAMTLERIAELIRQGYTSGCEPTWNMSGEDESDGDSED